MGREGGESERVSERESEQESERASKRERKRESINRPQGENEEGIRE